MQIKVSQENKNIKDIFIRNIKNNRMEKLNLKMGEVFKATITEKRNGIAHLNSEDNFKFQANTKSIYGDVGDELTFEVSKKSNDEFIIKQVKNSSTIQIAETEKLTSQENVKELMKRHNMSSSENMLNPQNQKSEIEEQKKIIMAKSKIQKTLSYTANNITQSAINELVANGLSLDKISLDILNNVMKEIEDKPPQQLSDSDIDSIVSHVSEHEINQKVSFSQKLNQSNLSVNEKNLKMLENVDLKIKDIIDIDKNAIANLLKSEKPITLENVYISKYSAKNNTNNSTDSKDTSEDDWEYLSEQTEKNFDRQGIEKNKKNIESAKFLLENKIDITKENIESYNNLTSMAEKLDADQIIQSSIKNIKKNINPYDVKLFESMNDNAKINENVKTYDDLITQLPNIKIENISVLLKKQIPLTLHNLRTQQNDFIALDPVYLMNDGQLSLSAQEATAKRQLAQIQLKMTKEAAIRLARQDINIDTMPLEEALYHLEEVEKAAYAKNLKIMGADETPENIETMNNLYKNISDFKMLTNNVFREIITNDSKFTIEGVSKSVKMARMIEDFENLATVANPKYGDSFAKIKDQFKDFLEKMGLESSDQNAKAASILSQNNMDISHENIIDVNIIDKKISRIQNTLHPNIAANMIREGLNPAEMHVDETLEYIDKFNGIYGEDLSDKISKHIMEMDDDKSIDDDTRKGIVAIYRMLSAVQKNDSIAIGASIKNGVNLTLGNLLDASEHYKSSRGIKNEFDITLDDDTGELESLNIPETNIRNILSKAYTSALSKIHKDEEAILSILDGNVMGRTAENLYKAQNAIKTDNPNKILQEIEYNFENIKSFSENASPTKLNSLMQESRDLKNKALDDLASKIQQMSMVQDVNLTNPAQITEFVRNLASTSSDVVHWMDKNDIPLTFNNIVSAKELVGNSSFISERLEAIAKEEGAGELLNDIESLDLEHLKSGVNPKESMKEISENLEQIKGDSTRRNVIKQISALQNAMKFQSMALSKSNGNSAQIHLKMHNKIAGLNMYVLNEKLAEKENQKIYMSLDTDNLGPIQIYLNISKDKTSLEIVSDREDVVAHLSDNDDQLKALIPNGDITIERGLQSVGNVVTEEIMGTKQENSIRKFLHNS